MCGRFLIDEQGLEDAMTIATVDPWIQQELQLGTVYPSRPALVIEEKNGKLQGCLMEFGFFSSSMNKRIINARAETVENKWMFRDAFARRRCAVVCSEFYEWSPQKEKAGYILPGKTMYLGAVALDHSFVILTRNAVAPVSDIHHRMPVVLKADEVAGWIENKSCAHSFLQAVPPVLEQTGESMPRLFE